MYLVFTKSENLISKLIMAITGEPVSHVGIQAGNTVVHWDFSGMRVESIDSFLSFRKIVFRDKIQGNYPGLVDFIGRNRGSKYDFLALLFLGLRYLFPKWMPKQNLWQITGMFVCTEGTTKYIYGKEDSLITPYKLHLKIVKEKII